LEKIKEALLAHNRTILHLAVIKAKCNHLKRMRFPIDIDILNLCEESTFREFRDLMAPAIVSEHSYAFQPLVVGHSLYTPVEQYS